MGQALASDYRIHIFRAEGLFSRTHLSETVEPYRYTQRVGDLTVRWKPGIEVKVYLDYRDESRTERLLKEALDVWNSVGGVNLVYAGRRDLSFLSGDCGESAAREGRVEEAIYVTALAVPNTESCLDPNSAGVTHSYYVTDSFGLSPYISLAAIFVLPQALAMDFEIGLGVMVHELGHAIALDHPFNYGEPNTYSVMNYYGKGTTLPSVSDRELIAYLYGHLPRRYTPPQGFYYRYAAMDYTPFGRPTLCIIGGFTPLSLSGLTWNRFLDHIFCYEILAEAPEIITYSGDECSFTLQHLSAGEDLCKNTRAITLSAGGVERVLAPQDIPEAMFSVGAAGEDGRLENGERIQLTLKVPSVQEVTEVVCGVVLPDGSIYLWTPEGFLPYEGDLVAAAELHPGESLERNILSDFPAEALPSGSYIFFTYLAPQDTPYSSHPISWNGIQ